MRHQAQVMETVGEQAEELAREMPMEKGEATKEEERARQDTFPGKERAISEAKEAPASSEVPRAEPVRKAQPARVKEFTGYKLAKEGEQAPASWTPKPRRR
jgi:hypothetical protein